MPLLRDGIAALALVVAACGTDTHVPLDPDPEPDAGVEPDAPPVNECETSYLTYETFGAPFAISWCRGCHSSAVPAGMRQRAPIDVNFDTHEDIVNYKSKILELTTGAKPSMPPAGGPSDEERALLAEWLNCGAK